MQRAKKILFVITKASWGGAQRYVYDLARAAQKAGYAVAVAYGEQGELVERLERGGVRTIRVEALMRDVRLVDDVRAYRALRALFARERPDAVHLNSSKAGGLGALAARLVGVPRIIFTAHGWAWNEARPLWQRILVWVLAGTTVLLSHRTICVSGAVARGIRMFPGAAGKLVVVRNGIACSALLPRSEARAELLPGKGDAFWIGMTSELHPTKRVEDAIAAFQTIAAEHPEAILVVLGEGKERARLEALRGVLGLAGRVCLLGFVEDAERYLGAFDLFLHSSRSEALGYAILEAGCAGLPVVATAVGGVPEVIEHETTGLLVPPGAPALLAAAVERLMDDPALAKRLGSALRERVAQKFTKDRMRLATLGLYPPRAA